MTLGGFLFGATLLAYLAAAAAYQAHLFTGSATARRLAPLALTAAIVLHAFALGERWYHPQGTPMSPAARVVSTSAWLLAVIQLLLDRRPGWTAVGALAVPLAFVAVLYANVVPHAPVVQSAVLKSTLM